MTLENIRNSEQPPHIHKVEGLPHGDVAHTTAEKAEEASSAFIPEDTPSDRFLSMLYSQGIINENGRLIIDVEHLKLPPLTKDQKEQAHNLLKKTNIAIIGGDGSQSYMFNIKIDEFG